MALETCNKQRQSSQGIEFFFGYLYVGSACKTLLSIQSCLKMDPRKSFSERLWAATPCILLHDLGAK